MSGRVRSVSANVRTLLDAGWEVASAPAGSTPADLAACAWHAASVPGTAADALRNAGRWSFDEARDEFTRSYLSQILQITGGNVSQAARLAKRNRTDFYKLLGRHQLTPEDFKQRNPT